MSELDDLIGIARRISTVEDVRAFCKRAYRLVGVHGSERWKHEDPTEMTFDTLRELGDMAEDDTSMRGVTLLLRMRGRSEFKYLAQLLSIIANRSTQWDALHNALCDDVDLIYSEREYEESYTERIRWYKVKRGSVWHVVAPRWLAMARDGYKTKTPLTACKRYYVNDTPGIGKVIRPPQIIDRDSRRCKACCASEIYRQMLRGGFLYEDEVSDE